MSNIQVKNVEPDLHEAARHRAAALGQNLSDYVLELIRRDLRRPARAEWLQRVRALPPVDISNDELLAGRDQDRSAREGGS